MSVGRAVAPKGEHTEKAIQDRVVLRMVNEAVFCLQDGTLHNAVDGDVGAVFGCVDRRRARGAACPRSLLTVLP